MYNLRSFCFFSVLWSAIFRYNYGSLLESEEKQSLNTLSKNSLHEAITDAFEQAEKYILQQNVSPHGKHLGRTQCPFLDASTRHSSTQSINDANFRKFESKQKKIEIATKILKEKYDLTDEFINLELNQIGNNTMLNDIERDCTEYYNITCDRRSRYRNYDGSCNNLWNPSWGMAATCFNRIMNPVYADGISALRLARSGQSLPRPRDISVRIHSHMDNPTDYTNHLFMQFGQLLAHDMSLSLLDLQADNQFLQCCPVGNNNNSQCAPIEIPEDDYFYSPLGIRCLSNTRTIICPTCKIGAPREQMNQATSFIDMSVIYGSSTDVANRLRTRRDGLLRTQSGNLLPESFDPANDLCSDQVENQNCFASGDPRVNTHVALTSLHTLFLRQHNHIARKLKQLNSWWSDERLYQETRKIIGAQWQVIVYKEYLPYLINRERMTFFNLNMQGDNVYTTYNSSLNPSITNEFAEAGFRFGHTMINSYFPQIPRVVNSNDRLRDLFFWPFYFYTNGYIDSLIRGMLQTAGQKFDRHIVPDVTNHLFQVRGNQSGLDLPAFDIYRGRDHGLPPYVDVVRFCGGPRINNFNDLDQLFRNGYRQYFEQTYENVNDIDLFSGGLAERHNPDAVVGPTFTCIIGIQFYRLKFGDRFYFEHGRQTGSFTLNQLNELKKTSLSKIICDNTNINSIQREALLYPNTRRNPESRCNNLPEPDLRPWRE